MSRSKLYITITVIAILVTIVTYSVIHVYFASEKAPTTTIPQDTSTYSTTNPSSRLPVIRGAGASFQYPQIAQWARLFQEKTGITITYQSVGSGAGQRMFLVDRVVDFAASDPPLSKSQWEEHKNRVLQVPWMMGAVAVVYNVPSVGGTLNLSGEVLAKIYLGEIEYWDDAAIVALNPTIADKLPHQPIVAVHRSDSSGTTEIFTLFLHKSAPDKWSSDLVGKQVDWPVDRSGRGVGAKGNEGVTAVVLQTAYSIGYVELSYAIEHGLPVAAIKNAAGKFVLPSEMSIQNAARGVIFPSSPQDDLSYTLYEVVYSPSEDAYPIATLAYGFFWAKYEDREVAKAVSEFLKWIVQEGYNYMIKGYTPPPQEAQRLLVAAARIIEENSAR
ncbi:MAG: phosphate ABC transporter substrate-binding protein PstS [Desulfurococcaceae archaeon]